VARPWLRFHTPSRPGEFHPEPLTGRVGDWRAGLGRSLCSLLARSFVRECHTISAVPRFQPPPRRTQHADFPHCALLFASPQGLWDLSAFALTYILRLRSCKSMDAFVISSLPSVWSETLQTAGLLRSTGVTPPQRCRVGGGALSRLRADLRPPLKLDVQFSRIQLSWMGLRSLKRGYQRD
jgi:hypothetical protein